MGNYFRGRNKRSEGYWKAWISYISCVGLGGKKVYDGREVKSKIGKVEFWISVKRVRIFFFKNRGVRKISLKEV